MRLKTPLEIHGARTPEEYRAKQRTALARMRLVPQVSSDSPEVRLNGEALRVKCPCGDYPIVDPKWALACCFGCGRIYEALVVPPEYR